MATAFGVLAHSGATGVVGERMMGMMMLADQVKVLTPLLAPGSEPDPAVLAEASAMITMHAGTSMTALFPEGSTEAPSEARPEIWERWQEFQGYADRLAELGAELGDAAFPQAANETSHAQHAMHQAPQLSEWEQLDFDYLIGLRSEEEPVIDEVVTGSIGTAADQPPTRPVQQVIADINATCSSCHAVFRR